MGLVDGVIFLNYSIGCLGMGLIDGVIFLNTRGIANQLHS